MAGEQPLPKSIIHAVNCGVVPDIAPCKSLLAEGIICPHVLLQPCSPAEPSADISPRTDAASPVQGAFGRWPGPVKQKEQPWPVQRICYPRKTHLFWREFEPGLLFWQQNLGRQLYHEFIQCFYLFFLQPSIRLSCLTSLPWAAARLCMWTYPPPMNCGAPRSNAKQCRNTLT